MISCGFANVFETSFFSIHHTVLSFSHLSSHWRFCLLVLATRDSTLTRAYRRWSPFTTLVQTSPPPKQRVQRLRPLESVLHDASYAARTTDIFSCATCSFEVHKSALRPTYSARSRAMSCSKLWIPENTRHLHVSERSGAGK